MKDINEIEDKLSKKGITETGKFENNPIVLIETKINIDNSIITGNIGVAKDTRNRKVFVFLKSLCFTNSVIKGDHLSFRNTIFCDEVFFNGSNIKSKIDFENAEFRNNVGFEDVRFEFNESANFSKSKFFYGVNFTKSHFDVEVKFFKTEFLDELVFRQVTFYKTANFRKAILSGNSDFTESVFKNNADFKSAEFISSEYNASYQVSFKSAEFNADANFFNTTFSESSYFKDTKFNGKANFSAAHFKKPVYFSDTKFNEKAVFKGSIFDKLSFFERSRFVDANFEGTLFKDNTTFKFAKFLADCNFKNTRFGVNGTYRLKFQTILKNEIINDANINLDDLEKIKWEFSKKGSDYFLNSLDKNNKITKKLTNNTAHILLEYLKTFYNVTNKGTFNLNQYFTKHDFEIESNKTIINFKSVLFNGFVDFRYAQFLANVDLSESTFMERVVFFIRFFLILIIR